MTKIVQVFLLFGAARALVRRGNKIKLKPPKYGVKAAQTARPTFMQVRDFFLESGINIYYI